MTQKPVFMEGIFTLRNVRSMGAAALIEILLALGIAGILIWQRLQPTIEQPRISTPPIVEVQQPIPPQPRAIPVPDQPRTPHLSEVPAVQTDIPGPNVESVQPPQAPVLPVQPSADLANQFETSVLRAINRQKVYPRTSLLKGDTGEAVVSFDYVDGVVSNIHVDRSSGFPELDQAAVDAVRKATLPAKPAELVDLRHFIFTLAFKVGG